MNENIFLVWTKKISIWVCVFAPLLCQSQYHSAEPDYEKEDVLFMDLEEMNWEDVVDGIDYNEGSAKKKEKVNGEKHDKSRDFNLSGLKPILRIVVILLLLSLLVYIILRLVKIRVSNQQLKAEEFTLLNEIESDLASADFTKWLRHAINKRHFKLAIRIYYLWVIKILDENNLIKYKKDKTNLNYLLEYGEQDHGNKFRNITILFEQVWYGDSQLGEEKFLEIESHLKNFIQSFGKSE